MHDEWVTHTVILVLDLQERDPYWYYTLITYIYFWSEEIYSLLFKGFFVRQFRTIIIENSWSFDMKAKCLEDKILNSTLYSINCSLYCLIFFHQILYKKERKWPVSSYVQSVNNRFLFTEHCWGPYK